VDPADPSRGFTFQGRIAEDFKLSTGTWVQVGPLRAALLLHFGDLVQDVGDCRARSRRRADAGVSQPRGVPAPGRPSPRMIRCATHWTMP
jgi:feruloyl-CoA synthase